MSTLVICLFIAALLPLLSKLPVAYAMHKAGGYDNHMPRLQQAQLEGVGARAVAAHQNSFEALSFFTPAVLAVMVTQQVSPLVQTCAISFVVARVCYHFFYLLDWALLRSITYVVAMAACLTMIWQAIPVA